MPLGRLSSALTKPRGSEAALTKSPAAPPRAPRPKRLSATRAACESRAIGFPLTFLLGCPARILVTEYTAVRYEPGMKKRQRDSARLMTNRLETPASRRLACSGCGTEFT